MSAGIVQAAYIVSALFFILSLAGLSKQESAKAGNYYGIVGMAIALLATIFSPDSQGFGWIILAMIIGGSIGIHYAKKVEMTEMPELVAILHSFVGLAAVLVGYTASLLHLSLIRTLSMLFILWKCFMFIAHNLYGFYCCFRKLRGVIPLHLLTCRINITNLAAIVISTLLLVYFVNQSGSTFALLLMTAIAQLLAIT